MSDHDMPLVNDSIVPALDLRAIDRLLAVVHRDDDQACSCDDCMDYGAEDVGADWFRIPVANRIAIRILDGADDRFALLAQAFHDHEAAALRDTGGRPPSDDGGPRPDNGIDPWPVVEAAWELNATMPDAGDGDPLSDLDDAIGALADRLGIASSAPLDELRAAARLSTPRTETSEP